MDSLTLSSFKTHASATSDVGRVRKNNEDAFLCEPELGLFAVADGMGGHAAGEVASAMAIETLRRALDGLPDQAFVRDPSLDNRRAMLQFLSSAIRDTNSAIYSRGMADPNLRGMGCTLDVAVVRGRSLFLAHVGDSRAYGMLGGTLYQLTEDHTFGQTLLSGGAMTAAEVATHPQRNLLMRALGVYPKVEVDTAYLDIAPGDVFMLCSDGVHGMVDHQVIEKALRNPVPSTAQLLIDAAMQAGGRDNATAVVVQITACDSHSAIRVGSEEIRRAMTRASLFAKLNAAELLRIQQIATGRIVSAGEDVFKKDEWVSDIYLVLDGQTSVWHDDVRVGWHGPGDPFGELSLFPAESLVTVRADVPTRLLRFPIAQLQELIASDHSVGVKLTLNALARVWQRFQQVAKRNARLLSGQ